MHLINYFSFIIIIIIIIIIYVLYLLLYIILYWWVENLRIFSHFLAIDF